jgi:TolB-like protein
MASLLERLKERKLVQWAIAYLAGAWALVEATGLVVEQFAWSATVGQVVTTLALFGFFVVLVLAWYHGEKGRQRVSGPELLMVSALLVVAGVALTTLGNQSGSIPVATHVGDGRPSIAVLPCANMSADPADEYLASSLHDEILLKLQGITSLFSVGRASVEWYLKNPAPLIQVAQELGVGFVGECSVQKHGGQIRLIFQLLDGGTGGQVWADDYDRDITSGNLFGIQRDIAQQVASGMRATLSPEDHERIVSSTTESTDAYTRYLRGRFYWRRDSTFALAHVGLADALAVYPYYGSSLSPQEARERATTAVRRALEIEPTLGAAYATLGLIRDVYGWDSEAAEEAFRRAVELAPEYPTAYQWYGLLLSRTGHYDEAVANLQEALRLDPLSEAINRNLGDALKASGRLKEAEAQFQATLELHPGSPVLLAGVLLEMGDYDALLQRTGWTRLAALVALGRKDEALEYATRFAESSLRRRSEVASALGDSELALTLLEQAYRERQPWLRSIRNATAYKPLRSDPRFIDLMERVGL